jgi:hypothetical protein
MHLARPLGVTDGGVRIGFGRQRLEQQLDLGIRFA